MRLFRRFSRKSSFDDRADEMQAHIDLFVEQLRATGRSAEEAQREARLAFGNPRATLEDITALDRLPIVETAWREVRFATRSLRRARSFTATVIAVLALAIGATTVVFSIVDTTILRGLPFDRADRLVAVGHSLRQQPSTFLNPISAAHFLELTTRTDVFERVAAVTGGGLTLKRDGPFAPQAIRGQRVTADFFEVLRVAPALGRFFTGENETEGRHLVAVISHGLWLRRFGGSADAITRRIVAEQGEFEIVGVTPEGFSYPVGAVEATEVWVPYVVPENERGPTMNLYLHPVARLQDGISVEQATARLNDPTSGVLAPFPSGMEPDTTLRPLHGYLTGHARPWLLMLLGAATSVLLIACVNVANLMLVRATARSHELRVRSALGATRWDTARSLLTEGLMLSVAGAAVGVAFAWWGLEALRALMPSTIPRQDAIGVDLRVMAVAAAAAVAIGISIGMLPMLWHLRPRNGSLRVEQNRSNTPARPVRWLRSTFVVSEVALAVVLLVGAVLFLTSFSRVVHVDLGLDYRNVMSMQVRPPLPPAGSTPDDAVIRATLFEMIERLQSVPGIEAAALANGSLPLSGGFSGTSITVPGRSSASGPTGAMLAQVSPGYFETLRIPIRRGRPFTSTDTAGGDPVAIINEAAAARFFGNDDPLGQIIGVNGQRTIVGIVGDVRDSGPEQGVDPTVFISFAQTRARGGTLLVRTTRLDEAVVAQVASIAQSTFPATVVPRARSMADDFASYIDVRRFNMLLLTVFGVLGLLIAAVGIYGVMAYVVSQRTREIGLRKALGARSSRVLGSILGRASAQIAVGLVVGLSAAWMMDGLVASFLFNVGAREIGLYAAAAVVLVVVGLGAALIPARRAARIDPVIALRSE